MIYENQNTSEMEEKEMLYKIGVHGCDDSTIFTLPLTEAEAAAIQKIGEKSEEVSTYGCMPTLVIEPTSEGE